MRCRHQAVQEVEDVSEIVEHGRRNQEQVDNEHAETNHKKSRTKMREATGVGFMFPSVRRTPLDLADSLIFWTKKLCKRWRRLRIILLFSIKLDPE